MQIRFFGYNTFLIESGERKIAIDPGGLFFYYFRFPTLIPESEWHDITHILITHGDPDHYWYADKVAAASSAQVVCNKTMMKKVDGRELMLGPRDKGVAFTTEMENVHTLGVDETIEVDGIKVTGVKATHGPLELHLGPITKVFVPGEHERIGWGALGFSFVLDNKRIVNLGDTLLHLDEWESLHSPDLLCIPIGGDTVHNTMGVDDAVKAVELMQPKLVIPVHYNCKGLFSKQLNPADDQKFRQEVEKLGCECRILLPGEGMELI